MTTNQPPVNINRMAPQNGRHIKDDGSVVNFADEYSRMEKGLYVRLADGPQTDAFGRLRVSQPNTLFDSQQEYGLDTRTTWDMAANGVYGDFSFNGSAVDGETLVGPRNLNNRMTPIKSGSTIGNKAVLQSRQYVRYIPGKSQFIAITGVFAATNQDEASIVLRSSTSGSPVEREFQKADWNVDKFDGTGPSGIIIDFTKTQILVIDAQWLAVGRVRAGFDIDGIFFVAHEYLNANQLIVPYTQTFNLPVRCTALTRANETDLCVGYFDNRNGVFLKNITPTQGGTMNFICCSVQSEGGSEARGFPWGARNVAARTISARTPVLAIRHKTTYGGIDNRAHAELIDYVATFTGNDCYLDVVIDGTIVDGAWAEIDPNSTMEQNITATTVTGGYRIRTGFGITGQGNSASLSLGTTDIRNPFVLSKIDDLAARQLTLAIVATPFTGSATVRAAMNWNEQTI